MGTLTRQPGCVPFLPQHKARVQNQQVDVGWPFHVTPEKPFAEADFHLLTWGPSMSSYPREQGSHKGAPK